MLHGTGIFPYIYHKFRWNVGKCTVHEASGIISICLTFFYLHIFFNVFSSPNPVKPIQVRKDSSISHIAGEEINLKKRWGVIPKSGSHSEALDTYMDDLN